MHSDLSESVSDGISDDSLFLPPRSTSSGTEDSSFSISSGTSLTDAAHSADPLWDYPDLTILPGGTLSDLLSDSVSDSLGGSFDDIAQGST
jgi:hypothetical protein